MRTGRGTQRESASLQTYDLIYVFHPDSGKSVCLAKTEDDYLDQKNFFLPLSQVVVVTPPESLERGRPCRVDIPDWLAKEKGLA